mgnify:CR=1 FL=1
MNQHQQDQRADGQLENRDYTKKLVREYVEQQPADIPAIIRATGLSRYAVEDALYALMEVHPCHLEVSERGELIYQFNFSRRFVPAPSLTDRLLTGLRWFFKAWIVLMPFFYILLFLELPRRIASFRQTEASEMYLGFGILIVLVYAAVLLLTWLLRLLISQLRRLSRKHQLHPLTPKRDFFRGAPLPEGTTPTRNPVRATYDYVFGTSRPGEQLAVERKLLHYVTTNQNRINISEVVRLTGWGRTQAEEELARFSVSYQGKPQAHPKGFVEFHFPDLHSEIAESKARKPDPVWINPPKLPRWNDNPRIVNTIITASQHFIWSFSFILLVTVVYFFLVKGENIARIDVFLRRGLIYILLPFLFTSTFFSVFIIGKQRMLRQNQHRLWEYNYHHFLKPVFASPEHVRLPEDNPYTQRAVRELNGELRIAEDATTYYCFPQIAREIA